MQINEQESRLISVNIRYSKLKQVLTRCYHITNTWKCEPIQVIPRLTYIIVIIKATGYSPFMNTILNDRLKEFECFKNQNNYKYRLW